jgi:hypothetical protein
MSCVGFDYLISGASTQGKNEKKKGICGGIQDFVEESRNSVTNNESSGSVAADQGESWHKNKVFVFLHS